MGQFINRPSYNAFPDKGWHLPVVISQFVRQIPLIASKRLITAITIETASWRGQNVAAERRVTAHVNLRLTDRRTGKLVWSARDVGANETYPVADSNQQTERNKRDAIAVLSKRMAEGIYNRLTTDF